jgi:hypothetical protein
MKKDQSLIDRLLEEVESSPIGNGGSLTTQYFFFKLNNISNECNPGEFSGMQSALTAARQNKQLSFSQGLITYHLKLLLEEGLIGGQLVETYEGACVAVGGLTAKGHAYLEERRKNKGGLLLKVLKSLKVNAPEWVARLLVTKSLEWALWVAGLFVASQIPPVKHYLLRAWLGQVQ